MRRMSAASGMLLALGVCTLVGSAQAKPMAGVPAMDRQFAMKAGQGGLAEVQLGALAAKQGSRQDVKDFGQKMVEDHSKANDNLKSIAMDKGIKLPSNLDNEGKAMKAKLSRLHGAAFDSAYIKAMREDHAKDVSEFKMEASMGKDPAIKGFASSTLPTIEMHYKMISEMSTKKGPSKMSGKMNGKMHGKMNGRM